MSKAFLQSGNRTRAVLEWPDGPTVQPVAVTGKEWIHGPFWSSDGRHVLVHGQLLGSTLTRLYLVDVRSGKVGPVSVPGFRTSGHGSWDLKETVMAFDGKREPPSPEAADQVRSPTSSISPEAKTGPHPSWVIAPSPGMDAVPLAGEPNCIHHKG